MLPSEVGTVPFKSKAQARWAFATKQKFAKRWAKKTKFKGLPAKKRKSTRRRKRR